MWWSRCLTDIDKNALYESIRVWYFTSVHPSGSGHSHLPVETNKLVSPASEEAWIFQMQWHCRAIRKVELSSAAEATAVLTAGHTEKGIISHANVFYQCHSVVQICSAPQFKV